MPEYRNYPYPNPVIAERITEVIHTKGLSCIQIANQIGIERKSIYSYMKGLRNPSIRFIRYLCINHNIDPVWLLDLD